ncbi:MAG: ABC transporter substrate-binding protein [Actinomycetota bacterium]
MTSTLPRYRRLLRLVAVLLASMLFLAACGDDDGDDADEASASAPATTEAETSDSADETSASAPATTEAETSDSGDETSASAPATTEAETSGPVTVVDGLGRTVTVDEIPESIACRDSGCSLVLADLGLVPSSTFFEPERAAFYYGDDNIDGITFAPVSVEDLATTEPDLIVINLATAQNDLDQLEILSPVYVIGDSGNLAENAEQLTTDLAALTGRVAEGEAAIARWEDFAGKLADIEIDGVEDVRLLQLWSGSPDTYLGWTSISDWCVLLDDLNLVGSCVFDPETPDQEFAEFSTEAVLFEQPTHISLLLEWQLEGSDEYFAPEQRTDPAWSQLDAVAAGNVYIVPSTGNFANAYYEIIYELENYLFHVFGPEQGFEDPGPFLDWDGPSL